jgi:hypothetical protein
MSMHRQVSEQPAGEQRSQERACQLRGDEGGRVSRADAGEAVSQRAGDCDGGVGE